MCGEKYWKLYTVLSCLGVVYLSNMLYFKMSCVYCCSCLTCIVVILCVFVVYVCIAVFTLDAGLLARSQYSEGPATCHLDTGFLGFPAPKSKC